MDDRELLELAAKAAGKLYNPTVVNPFGLMVASTHDQAAQYLWNPLTDDGDALRLAVNLGMDIEMHGANLNFGFVCASANKGEIQCEEECCAQDKAYATRRAIVRAAAEIGKSKKPQQ